MSYLPELLTVAAIHLLAVMSPGPDFALISRNSLIHSRRTGIFTSIGLGLGILVHVTYSLIGIGLIIAKSIIIFTTIKLVGAAYLIFIGYKSLRTKKKIETENTIETSSNKKEITPGQAIRTGFLTNVLNPKATLFFLSLFTQVIHPTTPHSIQTLYGIEMSLMTCLWFSTVAIVLSHEKIKQKFAAVQHYVERGFGILLIALGIKVALSR